MLLLNSEAKSLDNFGMLLTQQFDNIKYKNVTSTTCRLHASFESLYHVTNCIVLYSLNIQICQILTNNKLNLNNKELSCRREAA